MQSEPNKTMYRDQKVSVDPNKPKPPISAYMLFTSVTFPKLKAEYPHHSQKDLMTRLGDMWSNISPEEKKDYVFEGNKNKALYKKQIEEYNLMQKESTNIPIYSSGLVTSTSESLQDSSSSIIVQIQPRPNSKSKGKNGGISLVKRSIIMKPMHILAQEYEHEKPFECTLCRKRFKSEGGIKYHAAKVCITGNNNVFESHDIGDYATHDQHDYILKSSDIALAIEEEYIQEGNLGEIILESSENIIMNNSGNIYQQQSEQDIPSNEQNEEKEEGDNTGNTVLPTDVSVLEYIQQTGDDEDNDCSENNIFV